ncbi:MAG: 30S ribosome-binding factor RbfA [Cytophagales bacterium]|nr:30S ribosome-binding factor RbfA [Armatimonadota bacterium]
MPSIRQARVGEMIKRDLAEILQKEITDPRLALVSITGVDVAQDFSIAKVFVSAIGDEQEKMLALKALQGAAGYLRGRLGQMLELRTVPKLAFRYDAGVERGVRMFELLREEERNLAANGGTVSLPTRDVLPEAEEAEDDLARDDPKTAL